MTCCAPLRPALALLLTATLLAACNSAERTPSEAQQSIPQQPAETLQAHLGSGVGQAIYVPVYSHIYYRDDTRDIGLAATLSVRNTDPQQPVTLTAVRYHDSAGRLVRRYLDGPLALGPLASESFVVEQKDRAGGVGANFLVEWQAEGEVSAPLAEAVMISTASTQGISFVSRGVVVRPIGGGLRETPAPDSTGFAPR